MTPSLALPFRARPDRLTPDAIAAAASVIGCDVGAVRAVLAVESGGSGFLSDGRPKILFEATWFHRLTGGRFDSTHPAISAPKWDRSLYRGGAGEYDRLAEAADLDRPSALASASWGLFQILGVNHRAAGFPDVDAFVAAHCEGEPQQLEAFARFIVAQGWADELRERRWADFARRYNGPGQVEAYSAKLAAAYVQAATATA